MFIVYDSVLIVKVLVKTRHTHNILNPPHCLKVKCGVGGAWIAPNETDWPLCEYKDEYSCDPVEEIDKTDAYLASGPI